MDDVLLVAESIIKLEEVKEEPNDDLEESSYNLLEFCDSSSFFSSANEDHNAEQDKVQPLLPLLVPKEEVVEIKQEEEELGDTSSFRFSVKEEYDAEEDEVHPPLPLPEEEVAEIKQEEEDPLASDDSSPQEESAFSPGDGDGSLGKISPSKPGGSSSEDDDGARAKRSQWDTRVKEQVVVLAASGECSLSTAARRFGVRTRTAQRWMRRWRETGNLRRRAGTGRWRVSSCEEDARLLTVARSNPFLRSPQLKHALAFPGCYETVRKRLRDAGLVCWVSDWFPKILDAQRVDRLAFALDNAAREWGDVVFSSACVFSAAEDGPVRVFRPQVTQHNAGYVPEPQNCGRASVACWGWMSARGVGVVTRIEPAPLAAQYLHFLRNVMLPSVRVLYPEGSFYFQQDQLRVHKTDFVQEWLASQDEFEVVDWPPCSSDLNPMEDVWEETKQVMAKNWPRPQPKTCDALWELVSDAWDEVASREDSAAGLVSSMPRRLLQVIEREGS